MFILLNDVSTDLEDPPAYLANPPAKPEYDFERCKAPTRKLYENLTNHELPMSTAEVFGLVRLLVSERNWRVTARDDEAHRIQAVAITTFCRFRDDVMIEVRPKSGGAIVAMRSKSRIGRGDLGTNARRIRKFFRDL
ncbi:MAG: DUF1499 domain-containing protein [bacterium]